MNERLAENLMAHQKEMAATIATQGWVNGATLVGVLILILLVALIWRRLEELHPRRRS